MILEVAAGHFKKIERKLSKNESDDKHMKHENRVVTKNPPINYPWVTMEKICVFIYENPNLIYG